MNYRRSLLWLWIVGSAGWIAWWIWHYTTTCNLGRIGDGRAITCRWSTLEAGGISVATRTAPALTVLSDMAARTIGIPAYALIAGVALCWAIGRVRRQT